MGAPKLPKLSSAAGLNLVVLILASGRGERFLASGGSTHKLDAPIRLNNQTKTVLQATLDHALASGYACHVERSKHLGMGDAIAAAVAAHAKADGWLVLPADMPLVSAELIQVIAAQLNKVPIVVPVFKGRRGHPVGFSRACLNDLLQLTGDAGARCLFQKFEVHEVSVDGLPSGAGCLIDIDTVEDLESIQKNGIFG
jgi:molybdenum cofactor cytidylyltransferase